MFEIVCGRAMMCSISIDTQSGNIAMSANSFDWVYAGIKRPHRRRLSDKIISAFHAACDEGALDIATGLLSVLQVLVKHPRGLPGADRRKPEDLSILRERLWSLRYPSPWNTNADPAH
jgi:hypothetical protein